MIAIVAVRSHALTRGGGLAAFAVGTLTYGAGTIGSALVLLAFFITSTALSRAGRKRKRAMADIAKTGARDAWQVLANGGVATACLLVWIWRDHAAATSAWFVAFAGAYAAATADTWGTEIGMLAAKPPRSILTGKVLATGLSGGVTSAGTAAEIAGAVFIAILTPVALLLALPGDRGATLTMLTHVLAPVFAGGFGGALVDSVLGATLQERRWCPSCERECEVDPHGCGTATVRRRGLAWMTNDTVNFAATAAGALIAGFAFRA